MKPSESFENPEGVTSPRLFSPFTRYFSQVVRNHVQTDGVSP
jgi:hypothetical protein